MRRIRKSKNFEKAQCSSSRGDQYVKVYVEVPSKLSKKQKDALKAFEETLEDDKNYTKRNGFFEKIKDMFN